MSSEHRGAVRPGPAKGAAGWEQLFWLVFDQTSNPIALLDDARHIVDLNDAALSQFGGDRSALVGASMVDSIRDEDRDLASKDWKAFLASGEYGGQRVLVRADGTEVQVEFAARLADVGGRRLAIYVAITQGPGLPQGEFGPVDAGVLTNREREVVTLIALGRQTAQIAQELHLSPETVRTHVRNAMAKLGARTRAQLVATAICTDEVVHQARLGR